MTFLIKYVCSATTVDCFRVLSKRKWLMQQNYDNLQARTETLIQHCHSVWHCIWKHLQKIYTNTQIKASENLVPSNCTGHILVVEVMAENHHGYHEAIYLGCPVEQTTFLSWITQYRTQLNFTTPKYNIFWTNSRYFSASSPNTHKYLLATLIPTTYPTAHNHGQILVTVPCYSVISWKTIILDDTKHDNFANSKMCVITIVLIAELQSISYL